LFLNGNSSWEFSQAKFLGYNNSNAAVNMLTVQLAAELWNTGIKVNSADRGFTATDLNAHRGRQTILEGAAAAVRLASSAGGRSHRRLFQREPSGAVVTPNVNRVTIARAMSRPGMNS
jgi:NAD(P)-dependent dehydrogenase (short-subunit alcohol dehydrogenase family)